MVIGGWHALGMHVCGDRWHVLGLHIHVVIGGWHALGMHIHVVMCVFWCVDCDSRECASTS